ncbi:unnamed protein product [Periconia digitata]|uniref:Uncharacterized protein n=1 Tax=Periconia digitata TaxID=1303443 RepID=A0A9W4UN03_9PLEO|nr:unnamed protein product [Periconia digitata]
MAVSRPFPQIAEVVVVGAQDVGKSCFVGMFCRNERFPMNNEWEIDDTQNQFSKAIQIEEETWYIQAHDLVLTPSQESHTGVRDSYWSSLLARARGVILLYDITDEKSYESVTKADYETILTFRQEVLLHSERVPDPNSQANQVFLGTFRRFGGLLVGNKLDKVIDGQEQNRQVPKSLAAEWADMHGMKHFEIDTHSQKRLGDVMRELIQMIKKNEQRDNEDMEQKRKSQAKAFAEGRKNLGGTSTSGKPKDRKFLSGLSRSLSKIRHKNLVATNEAAGAEDSKTDTPTWNMFLS